ncbi:hypothetical protein LIER_14992 [Lithospermum erythrorhizon]|uniref:Retrotransposon gag domain-containing protein n=1 Tax=Lithospermum erythrorhizon TaxID=34254 RepID=A0AAV3Q158_LITER
MKLPTFTKFTGKTDPDELIAAFQSQMSIQHPYNKVYCQAFPSSLAGPALKWFKQLLVPNIIQSRPEGGPKDCCHFLRGGNQNGKVQGIALEAEALELRRGQ